MPIGKEGKKILLLLRFRQARQGQQHRGHRAEGSGGEDTQPVDIAQHGGAGADIGQSGFGKGADGADAGRLQLGVPIGNGFLQNT